MKCIKRTFLVVLLVALLPSLAFCGWDGFKSGSSDLSDGSLSSTEKETAPEMEATEQPPMLSEEVKNDKNQTDRPLKNYEESSEEYDEVLEETKVAIEEAEVAVAEAMENERPKKAEAKKEAVANAVEKVEELIASKAALDENYNILADITMSMAKENKRLARQEAFKVGAGLAVGYKYLDTIPLGFNIGFLFNEEWTVGIVMTYDIHATGGMAQFMNPAPENIGAIVTVTKYF